MKPKLEIVGIEVSGLRGFDQAKLDLDREAVVLIGPNNSGKTSFMRLLDWIMNNADDDVLSGRRELSAAEQALLLPARKTHRARRLVLEIRVNDGRSARPGWVDSRSVARLRIRVHATSNRAYAMVSPPKKSEGTQYEKEALTLLRRLRTHVRVVHVPAARDATSDHHSDVRRRAVRRLLSGLEQSGRGRPTTELQSLKQALDKLEKLMKEFTDPILSGIGDVVVSGLVEKAEFVLRASEGDLLDWLSHRAVLSLATGAHDSLGVPTEEVGAGLQSLIELAVFAGPGAIGSDDRQLVLCVDEPEAFLHPSAQRSVARMLLQRDHRVVVSSHSPLVVDEAHYGQVVIVRDHRVFDPMKHPPSAATRLEVTTTGRTAEALFSRSVLLVEGPGDWEWFESLRRRLAQKDRTGSIDKASVIDVGGNSGFDRWLNLLRSYRDPGGAEAFHVVVLADGIDAIGQVFACARKARYKIPTNASKFESDVRRSFANGNESAGRVAVSNLNSALQRGKLPLLFLPVDLEDTILANVADDTAQSWGEAFGFGSVDREELRNRLGSKAGRVDQGGVGGKKAPWMRAHMGVTVPAVELSTDTALVLERWIAPLITAPALSALRSSI